MMQQCSYMVYKFDEVWFSNPRYYEVRNFNFLGDMAKNWHIPPNISECTRLIFTKYSDLVGIHVRMIKLTFICFALLW